MRGARYPLGGQVHQARESPAPYRSKLVDFLRDYNDVLERLAVEISTRDLPTRDIEDSFREARRAGNSFASSCPDDRLQRSA